MSFLEASSRSREGIPSACSWFGLNDDVTATKSHGDGVQLHLGREAEEFEGTWQNSDVDMGYIYICILYIN